MDAANPILTYWYFHLPNYLLAALMYTLIGRLILSFILPPDSANYIWRAFVRITNWLVRLVALITPRIAAPPVLLVFAVLWLMVARFALFALLAPRIAATPA